MTFYMVISDQGEWLPQLKGRKSNAATRSKLTKVEPPRLFKRKSDAQCALNWWKKGFAYPKVVIHSYESEVLTSERVPERDNVNLTVKAFTLIF